MPEQTQPNGSGGESQPFSMQQAIQDAFAAINRNPLPDPPPGESVEEATVLQESTIAPSGEPATRKPPAPVSSNEDYEAVAKDRDTWKKNYDNLQSDIDRRVNKAVEKMQEQFNGQIQALTAALTRVVPQQQPPNSDYGQEGGYDQQPISTRQQLQQLIQQEALKLYQQQMAQDPRIQMSGALGDWARYRMEFQDSEKFHPLVETVLEEFPELGQRDLYNNLSRLYKVGQKLIEKATRIQQANAQGEAARTQTQPSAGQVQPQGNPRANAEQLAALQNRAGQYRMERGVSPSAQVKPSIDTNGDLNSAVDALVGNIMRRQG